jgi:hypothetical protein
MPRRLLMLLALVASLAVVACSNTPAAQALTDPKEILTKSIASLANVKTATIKGTFSGSINAAETGAFDLSTLKVDLAVDIPAKKTRVQVDAPTLMGTNLDMIVADGNVYLKVVGPLASFVGADATGKYTKTASGATVPTEATDPTKAIEEVRAGLDKLPKAPEKLADERCGDQDCYHVKLALTGADLATLGAGDGEIGNVSLEVWSRKNDLRPAKISFTLDMAAQGTVSGTFEFTYDQGVNISAPPADQIAP